MTENHNAQRQPASPDKVTVQPPTFSSAPPTPPKQASTFIDTNMSSSTPIQSIEQPSPRINELKKSMKRRRSSTVASQASSKRTRTDEKKSTKTSLLESLATNHGWMPCGKLSALDLWKATDFHPMEHPAELKMLTEALYNTTGG
ncbi:hypothetical protein D6C92_03749 [Aureobasidium pullulans]|nr:hypothetical protein D6C92_03749 [Aureobasidium pullulans]